MTYKRQNGFAWPPDKAQIFSWLLIVYFLLIFCGTFLFSLAYPWSPILGSLFLVIILLHVSLNLSVMAINPGEESALKKKVVPVATFDSNRHKHVIENQFCNICQIVV